MVALSTKIENLKKKQAQLRSKIISLEASEKSRERKRETRRKILIGSYFLEKARSENSYDDLVKKMDEYLSRESDREVFDLKTVENIHGKNS